MFSRDKWNEIIEALSANPFRTLITAFGVFWGIFILVILLSASQGLQNGIKRQMGGLSTNTMFMWTSSTSKPYKGLPHYGDIENRRKVTVIGEGVIRELYAPGEEVLGSYIKVQGVNFMVVGVYKSISNMGGDAEESQKQLFIPFTTFQQAFNYGDIVGWMTITAEDNKPITDLKESIFKLLKNRHTIDPTDDRAVGHFDLYQEFKKINGLFSILTAVS